MAEFKSTILLLLLSSCYAVTITTNPQQQEQAGTSCSCPCNAAFMTGPAGPPGVPGPSGPPGHPGMVVQGPQGLTGPAGDPGIPGVPGQGIPGSKGSKGDIGQGQPGGAGVKGERGLIGLPGQPGPIGFPGKIGPQGIKGEQGMMGIRGEQGMMGIRGEQGMMGVRGHKGGKGEGDGHSVTSAFTVYRASSLSVTSGSQVITYQEEDFDIGDDMDPTTGIYTCPISGIYYFSFSMWASGGHSTHIELQVNGVNKGRVRNSKGERYMPQGAGMALSLQAGDEVKLTAVSETRFSSSTDKDSFFSGFLLHIVHE